MHIFKSGDFRGQSIDQAMLRDAPRLYKLMEWAQKEKIRGLQSALKDFGVLRRKLQNAAVKANCAESGCQG